jgi:tetratricopeptide (TPR) repeat protein
MPAGPERGKVGAVGVEALEAFGYLCIGDNSEVVVETIVCVVGVRLRDRAQPAEPLAGVPMTLPFLSSEDYDERAHHCYDAGEYDQALSILRDGLARYPDAADLHVGLGYVRLAREEFAWARQSFAAAIELEDDHEDAWVGMGEVLLKFGETRAAVACFARIDELGLADDLDLGLAIGRALYREGMFHDSRERLTALSAHHPESAELRAATGYTLHALGDEAGAARELRRALRADGTFHEARIYLSHLLYERGDHAAAMQELSRVPPDEHWDSLSLWRVIDLKMFHEGLAEDDPALRPWRERLSELDTEPDEIDHLLAEVETAFGEGSEEASFVPEPAADRGELRRAARATGTDRPHAATDADHRVRTREGDVFVGTWAQIVEGMRDRTSEDAEPISTFMSRAAARIRRLTGRDLPHDDPEAFVRASAMLGLLEIEN